MPESIVNLPLIEELRLFGNELIDVSESVKRLTNSGVRVLL